MSITEPSKKAALPQIIKLNTAIKLKGRLGSAVSTLAVAVGSEVVSSNQPLCKKIGAEVWVNNMTEVEDDEPVEAEKEGRPSRLGLGAKVPRQPKVASLNDPVGRKLYTMLDLKKRKAAQIVEESRSAKTSIGDDDDDEDNANEDSRTSAFVKKVASPLSLSIQRNKKRK